jgi:hypothetical protein
LLHWRAVIVLTLALGLPATSQASGHEVDRSALRRAIADGEAIPFSDLQNKVEARLAGALVDVSLYDVGSLYYRVLVRQPNGRMVSAVLEARTGSFVPVSSDAARAVQDTARTRNGGGFLGLFSPAVRPGVGATQPGTPGAATGSGSSGSASGGQSTADQATGSAGGNASAGGQSSSASSGGGGNAGGGNAGGGNAGQGNAGNGNSGSGSGNAGSGNASSAGGNANSGGGSSNSSGSSANAGGGNANAGGGNANAGGGNANAGGGSSNGNGQGRN